MYLKPDEYADFITAYKTFMLNTAKVMTRELGENVSPDILGAAVENIFTFETSLAYVRSKLNPCLVVLSHDLNLVFCGRGGSEKRY